MRRTWITFKCATAATALAAVVVSASAQSVAVMGAGAPRATAAVASLGASPSVSGNSAAAREGLRDQARDWVASQTATDSALIRIGALDGRVNPPVCESGYRFDFPFEARSTVRAHCDNPVRQYYLRISVERVRQRLVLARSMAAGEIVSQSDLTMRDLAGSSGGIDSAAQIVGRSLRRAIGAGEAPLANDLEDVATVVRAAADLRAGDMIPVTVLRTELLPRSKIPLGAVTRVDDLNRARLRRDVPADRVLVSDDLIDTRPVVVARRNMMRGETIDSTALEVIEMDRRALPADHLSSAQGLEQGEVNGMIRAGEPVRASMVRPALMVRKGQIVLLSVARSGIEISVQVEALEDAKLGDQVKLRNPDSGKPLAGMVTGRGAARAL